MSEATNFIDGALPATMGVLGGGRMGAGIAHGFLVSGSAVTVVERDEESAKGAYERVVESVDKSIARGAVSETRVREGLENAHVFALASLNEGISVAIMEAMAMEMPVVVTDVGGNHELITSGRDAILVPPERPDLMAAEIAALDADPGHALRLAQASRARVAADFHHRRSAEAVADGLARSLPDAAQALGRSPGHPVN